ncbi:hypothetical protein EUBSIR_00265 [[Eubacterium] siraeum DSM 15702]|uniref:Uncharacterized protein n=1 Tax=[Eubacterium] siraeum DSM 15702 TaxID=428128 RepID=B0MKE9_9FIRM|nr:hypothetical protein EUBSIR_00265 [[Eubacterium] siraeum DSM 15702]
MFNNKNSKYKQITITTFRRCLCRSSAENLPENNRLKSHYTVNDSTSFLLRNIITRCDKKRCRTTVK